MNKFQMERYVRYLPHSGEFWRVQMVGTTGNLGKIKSEMPWIKVRGIVFQKTHIAFLLMTGKKPERVCFIDGDEQNYKWDNMADRPPEMVSQKPNGTWRAYWYQSGKQIHLGVYKKKENALKAVEKYKEAK